MAQIKPGGPNSARQVAVQPRISPHVVRHLLAFDSAKVPRVPATSLPASGAVSRRKRPKLSLSNLTPPAQRPSSPRLAQAYPHAVLHLLALDSPKVPRLPSLRGSLETEVALLKSERPNSARPVAVQPRISPGCLSRGATPPYLGFGEGPACGAPLPPRLRGSLEMEVVQIKPERPNSPPCLGFGNGPVRRDPLPPHLRGGLEAEVTLLKPERPNSARPGALLPQISHGRLSHGATTLFLSFSEGPASAGPLPPRLRGSLEMEVAQIKPGGPNSARQVAVQPRISPGRPSRGATPPCLRFGEGPTRAGHLPPRLRGSLETEEAQIKPEQPNSARPAAVQPQISPGLPSRGATPPCLGFAEGPAPAQPQGQSRDRSGPIEV